MLFRERPADFSPACEAASCFCEYGLEFLLLYRSGEYTNPFLWGLPGGTVDPGESPSQAARRELEEETGLVLPEGAFALIRPVYIRRPTRDFTLHLFRAPAAAKEPIRLNPLEHTDYRWVAPAGAKSLPLIPEAETCIDLAYPC
ncbi:MAG TPA: NUDIX hydrolase [archaeon]|nr:NUDIX hydrolase [archaeon]